MNMMKKANAVLAIALLALVTSSVLNLRSVLAPPATASLYVDPPLISDPLMKPPKIFTVDIVIDDVENLYGYEINLDYNTKMLTAIGVEVHQVHGEGNFTNDWSVMDAVGQVWINVSYYPPAVPITTYTPESLVTLTFKVDAIGSGALDLHDTELWDETGSLIDHTESDGFVMTEIHDVSITGVVASPTSVFVGTLVTINVTAKNNGNTTETFYVKTYFDSNPIGTQTVPSLPPTAETLLTFTWDTTGVSDGLFTIKAEAEIIPYEFTPADNTYIDGTVAVMTRLRDLAILNVTTNVNATYADPLWPVYIDVLVENQGMDPETFEVTVYWNDTHLIGSQTVIGLAPNATTMLTFMWDTTSAAICHRYKMSANVTVLEFEVDTLDNRFDDGYVKVKIMGDLNGDGKVDIRDLAVVSKAFGSYPGHPRWNPDADLNKDLKVDIRDIAMAAKNFGQSCP